MPANIISGSPSLHCYIVLLASTTKPKLFEVSIDSIAIKNHEWNQYELDLILDKQPSFLYGSLLKKGLLTQYRSELSIFGIS